MGHSPIRGNGAHLVGEEASERRPCRDELFPGLRPLLTPPKRGVRFAKISSFGCEHRQRRVLKAQRGGSVPNEIRSPARSLVPAWTPLARHFFNEPRSRSRRNAE
jgi:hypothetical protein